MSRRTQCPDFASRNGAHRVRRVIAVAVALASLTLTSASVRAQENAIPDDGPWARILSRYVTPTGRFRYRALLANRVDRAILDGYIRAVGAADVAGADRDAKLAFYLNAYNALVVKSVLDLWPLESVREKEGFFDARKHLVAGQERTLDALENRVIRSQFAEPRIHFALNCASTSCPPLARRPLRAETLNAQLAAQTRAFVRQSTRVDADTQKVFVSRLFEWFADDFGGAVGVRRFVARHSQAETAELVQNAGTTIAFTEYDWALNGAR